MFTTSDKSRTPLSPDSDNFSSPSGDMLQMTGILNMKSPLSVLAHDMDINLNIGPEYGYKRAHIRSIKTPKKCLLSDLQTAMDTPQPSLLKNTIRFEERCESSPLSMDISPALDKVNRVDAKSLPKRLNSWNGMFRVPEDRTKIIDDHLVGNAYPTLAFENQNLDSKHLNSLFSHNST